jgi:hypothetical protein
VPQKKNEILAPPSDQMLVSHFHILRLHTWPTSRCRAQLHVDNQGLGVAASVRSEIAARVSIGSRLRSLAFLGMQRSGAKGIHTLRLAGVVSWHYTTAGLMDVALAYLHRPAAGSRVEQPARQDELRLCTTESM